MTLLMEPVTRTLTEERTQTGNGAVAHIVGRNGANTSPQAIVLEARIYGTPVTALCGYVWVPHKNPAALPVCEPCKEIYALSLEEGQNNGELPEA